MFTQYPFPHTTAVIWISKQCSFSNPVLEKEQRFFSPLCMFSMNSSQYRADKWFFWEKTIAATELWSSIYIVLFIYTAIQRRRRPCIPRRSFSTGVGTGTCSLTTRGSSTSSSLTGRPPFPWPLTSTSIWRRAMRISIWRSLPSSGPHQSWACKPQLAPTRQLDTS